MTKTLKHRFIAIEGNIGAGKTTLCQMMAADFNCRLILEQFTDNPFLPFFYENPDRYAFPVELFFMTERHKQLQIQLATQDLFQQRVLADYFFIKTLLFAKNNLSEEEYRLFQHLFHVLNAAFPKPDLLVYLHRPVDNLIENIKKRARDFETDITPDYLQSIQKAYFDYFKMENKIPILVLNAEDIDFQNNKNQYNAIIDALNTDFIPGVHYVDIDH